MSTPYPPTIEDRLNAAFVLSAALYFKSIRIETGENAAASLSLAGDLHTIARDLAALSECPTDALIEAKQMPRGVGDLLQSLEELIGLARESGHDELEKQIQTLMDTLQALSPTSEART